MPDAPAPANNVTPPATVSDYPPWFLSHGGPRLVAWAVVLAGLYFFQAFFFIGILTFLTCYLVHALVVWADRKFFAPPSSRRRELWLTVTAYLVILAAAVGLWWVMVPRLIVQGRELVARLVQFDYQAELDQLLDRTVGEYLFRKKYGGEGSGDYAKALQEFAAGGRRGQGLYERFPAMRDSLLARFEATYDDDAVRRLQGEFLHGHRGPLSFDAWFLENKAPEIYEAKRPYFLSRWLARFAEPPGPARLKQLQSQANFEERRDAEIAQKILEDVKKDPVQLATLKAEWEEATNRKAWAAVRSTPKYRETFQKFYDQQRQQSPADYPYDYATYVALADAYAQGKEAFLKVLAPVFGKNDDVATLKLARHDFEVSQKRELAEHWWESDPTAIAIRGRVMELMPVLLGDVEGWFSELFRSAMTLPMEIVTALFFALYINFDWPNLKRRANSLGNTKLSPFYHALAPDLVLLARQIGSFFQTRVVVAAFNTLFVWIGLWWLGIESELLLCLVVFVTSFIPIVGVFIAGVPIVLIAILQPGGSVTLALQAAVVLTVVHLIEANLLSPYLMGKAAELHPITILLALVVGEYYFGMWGLILGVPVASFLSKAIALEEPKAPEATTTAVVSA